VSTPEPTREGFEQWVAARRGALLRTAYLLTGDAHGAEDLVQVALLHAVPKWTRITSNPEPYVRKILARESVNRWRRRRWREVQTEQPPETTVEGPGDDRVVLQQALARLAPRQRAVIVLRYYEDLTERETAALLGVSVGTVKSQARDALVRLRDLVPDLARELEDVGTSTG
jgi:RNA polymerase sigma-70 factor (sigma-E family)